MLRGEPQHLADLLRAHVRVLRDLARNPEDRWGHCRLVAHQLFPILSISLDRAPVSARPGLLRDVVAESRELRSQMEGEGARALRAALFSLALNHVVRPSLAAFGRVLFGRLVSR